MYTCLFCGSNYEAPKESYVAVAKIAKEKGRGAVKIKCCKCNKHSTLMAESSSNSVNFFEWKMCHEMANQEVFDGQKV